MLVGSGSGMSKDGKITSGGTTVIGQDQDTVGGGFEVKQSFVGDVTEVNVWGTVLSESDILAQYHNCHITIGSVNEWRDFEDGVQGDTEVIPPSCWSTLFSARGSSNYNVRCWVTNGYKQIQPCCLALLSKLEFMFWCNICCGKMSIRFTCAVCMMTKEDHCMNK